MLRLTLIPYGLYAVDPDGSVVQQEGCQLLVDKLLHHQVWIHACIPVNAATAKLYGVPSATAGLRGTCPPDRK